MYMEDCYLHHILGQAAVILTWQQSSDIISHRLQTHKKKSNMSFGDL